MVNVPGYSVPDTALDSTGQRGGHRWSEILYANRSSVRTSQEAVLQTRQIHATPALLRLHCGCVVLPRKFELS